MESLAIIGQFVHRTVIMEHRAILISHLRSNIANVCCTVSQLTARTDATEDRALS
jgi:hypothetical protein